VEHADELLEPPALSRELLAELRLKDYPASAAEVPAAEEDRP
jgi:hypothetical protein